MDARSTVLNEHLGELHRGSEAAVPGVCISNDRVQVVHNRRLGTVRRRHATSLLVLLAVVEELSPEELVHLPVGKNDESALVCLAA